jgi:hypothetical protein
MCSIYEMEQRSIKTVLRKREGIKEKDGGGGSNYDMCRVSLCSQGWPQTQPPECCWDYRCISPYLVTYLNFNFFAELGIDRTASHR